MSPEQAEGELDRLGPRSDVYSLGATLYCLLTGKPPFDGRRRSTCSAPCSGANSVRRASSTRSIDPALEAVCLKAMAHRPEDRYASRRALADDLDRWMADEPVSAWREPLARRARRWARRNRTAVTAAAVALVAGVVGLSAVLAVQTQAKADLAASLKRETTPTAWPSQRRADPLAGRRPGPVRPGRRGDQDVSHRRQRRLPAQAGAVQGRPRPAAEVGQRLLRQARCLAGQGVGPGLAAGAVAGELRSGRADGQGRQAGGRAGGTPAGPRRPRGAGGRNPGRPGDQGRRRAQPDGRRRSAGDHRTRPRRRRRRTARPRHCWSSWPRRSRRPPRRGLSWLTAGRVSAGCSTATGRNDEALSVYRLARADQEALAAAPGATAESRRDLAATINGVAILLAETGKPSEAEAEYRKALAIQQKLADDNPAVTEFRSDLAISHNNLGILLMRVRASRRKRRPSTARRWRSSRSWPTTTPPSPTSAATWRYSHNNLGILLSSTGKPSEAEAEYRKALAIQQKLADDNPAVTEFRSRLALSHNNLGCAAVEYGQAIGGGGRVPQGAGDPAEAGRRQPRRHRVPQPPGDQPQQPRHACCRVRASHRRRRPSTARHWRSSRSWPTTTPPSPNSAAAWRTATTTSACLLSNTGKSSEAEAEYRKALAIQQKLADDNPAIPDFRGIWRTACSASVGSSRRPEKRTRRSATTRGKRRSGRSSPRPARQPPTTGIRLANCQTNTADVLRRSGRLDEALAACERALAVREPLVEAHPEVPQLPREPRRDVPATRAGAMRHGKPGRSRRRLEACAARTTTGPSPWTGEQTFFRACCHAGLAGLAGRPGSGVSAAEGADQAEKAMAVLRQAVTMGYRNPDAYRTESALDPLRNRPDFRALTASCGSSGNSAANLPNAVSSPSSSKQAR